LLSRSMRTLSEGSGRTLVFGMEEVLARIGSSGCYQ
jgi:hypothetical protein